MRLLLDTNILILMVDGGGRKLPAPIVTAIEDDDAVLWASVASIWEVAIKHRLGKLALPCRLEDWPGALTSLNIAAIPVRTAHAIRAINPVPLIKDPFDKLLLAICAAEQMRLITLDDELKRHPLAWKAPAA